MDRAELRVFAGAAKVCEKLSSVVDPPPILKAAVLSPIRCGLSSSFFQVTVVAGSDGQVPPGVKAKLSISTTAGLAAARTTASPAAVNSDRVGSQQRGHSSVPNHRAIRRTAARD